MKVAELYNTLQAYHRFSKKTDEQDAYAIHKRFADHSSYKNVNDWLLQTINFDQFEQVLDAGCGVGASSLVLAKHCKGEVHGCTLSKTELAQANVYLKASGIKNCNFFKHDFSKPFQNQYDFILGIESFKHSEEIVQTLNNVKSALAPKGQLLIVEDVVVNSLENNRNLRLFKEAWCLKQVYNGQDYKSAFKGGEMKEFDLTSHIRIPSRIVLAIKKKLFYFLYLLAPSSKIKQILLIFLGGFILDSYYAEGKVRYKAMLFTNN